MTNKELLKEIKQLPVDERDALLEASLDVMVAQVSSYVFRLTLDKALAEQIVEETFRRFLTSMWRDKWPEVKNLNAYLYKTALNVYLSRQTGNSEMTDVQIREPKARPSEQAVQTTMAAQPTLSERLRGILKFDGDPPDDEQVKDLIVDHLIRKYS